MDTYEIINGKKQIVKKFVDTLNDYTNIANAVKASYLANGELDMNMDNRYKYWITKRKLDFKKFDYNKLSAILRDKCDEIETKRDYGKWYSIFLYKNDYFEFYERKNKIIFIHSNDFDDLIEMDDIDFDAKNYEIINGKKYKKCPEGKVRNMITMRCIKTKIENKKEKIEKKKQKVDIKHPLNYSFNKDNVRKFLNECNKPFYNPEKKKIETLNTYDISKKIIDNTEHISFEKFLRILELNIEDMINLLEKDRPLFICIINKKRTYWLLKYVIEYININYPTLKIILLKSNLIDDKNITNNDMIVLLDEFIFSVELGISIQGILNITNYKLRFFILSSFANKSLLNFIEKSFTKLANSGNKLIFNKTIIEPKTTNDILTTSEIKLLSDVYQILGKAVNKNLIYFDHNLGDPIYILTAFYNGIIPNAENMYYLSKKYRRLDKLNFIPILTNCEHITKYKFNNNCPSTY